MTTPNYIGLLVQAGGYIGFVESCFFKQPFNDRAWNVRWLFHLGSKVDWENPYTYPLTTQLEVWIKEYEGMNKS